MTDDFIRYVETRFRDYMNVFNSDLEVLFSNEDEPTSHEWVVCHVIASDSSRPLNLGIESKSRNVGVIQLDVYTAADIGAGKARRIATDMATIFHRHTEAVFDEGQATFKDASMKKVGKIRGRFMYYVSIPYRYDFVQERALPVDRLS